MYDNNEEIAGHSNPEKRSGDTRDTTTHSFMLKCLRAAATRVAVVGHPGYRIKQLRQIWEEVSGSRSEMLQRMTSLDLVPLLKDTGVAVKLCMRIFGAKRE
jgi:hypothetical protein